ncbi:type I DNA topoisomerase [Sesbania bispinosa]|nr:type I DNA topoisomerase [Sesbania bispinosa]
MTQNVCLAVLFSQAVRFVLEIASQIQLYHHPRTTLVELWKDPREVEAEVVQDRLIFWSPNFRTASYQHVVDFPGWGVIPEMMRLQPENDAAYTSISGLSSKLIVGLISDETVISEKRQYPSLPARIPEWIGRKIIR